MVSEISYAKNYEWVLTSKGEPDMRLRKNRENILDMVKQLDNALTSQQNKTRRVGGGKRKACVDDNCAICMEEMKGKTVMRCGHEMCTECFANHARVNHKCPFCRDEFAAKPKEALSIPDEAIHALIDHMYESSEDYFSRAAQVVRDTDLVEGTHYIEYLIKMNNELLGRSVAAWYDMN